MFNVELVGGGVGIVVVELFGGFELFVKLVGVFVKIEVL